MGSNTERAFLVSVIAIDEDAPPSVAITEAFRGLVALTRARYGRAELQLSGDAGPVVLATLGAFVRDSNARATLTRREELAIDSFESGFATARLELHSRRSGVDLTFRERALFHHLFQAMARAAQRVPTDTAGARNLHDATREFHAKLVTNALRRADGNVTLAARELRVTRGFIYKMLRGVTPKHA